MTTRNQLRNPGPMTGASARSIPLLRIAIAMCILAVGAAAQSGSSGASARPVANERTALEEYVKTRRIISREKRDWALDKRLLTNQTDVLKRSVTAAEKVIKETNNNREELEKAVAEREAEKARMDAVLGSLEKNLEGVEARVRKLLLRLPERLRSQLQVLIQQIPNEGKQSKLSIDTRYRNVIGILNEANKFNHQIAVFREFHDLPSGKKAEASTLYVGLGRAYYVTDDGKEAGVGGPDGDKWIWVAKNDAAPQIAKAIAMFESKEDPGFVPLPLEIK